MILLAVHDQRTRRYKIPGKLILFGCQSTPVPNLAALYSYFLVSQDLSSTV